MFIPISSGALISGIPLNALAVPELVPSQSPISHFNGRRTNSVQAHITRGVLPQEALKVLQQDLEENPIALPDGYSFNYGGDTD